MNWSMTRILTGTKVLKGKLKGLCRVRAGDYRILYTVDSGELVIDVIEIGNRRNIYD